MLQVNFCKEDQLHEPNKQKSVAGWSSQWSSQGGAHDGVIADSDDVWSNSERCWSRRKSSFPVLRWEAFLRNAEHLAIVTKLLLQGAILSISWNKGSNYADFYCFVMCCYRPGHWTDKEANIRVQKSTDYREFRVINFWTSWKAKTTVTAAGWKFRNFPHPKLECNSRYERRFSPIFHYVKIQLTITPMLLAMEEFEHGKTWEMGSFRCQEFELLWNAEVEFFRMNLHQSVMNPCFCLVKIMFVADIFISNK